MFKNLQEFHAFLSSQNKFSMKLHLTRINRACELLDNPQLKVPAIHIAGTNGKGSTCNYLSNLLQQHGLKVGLYISPYIICFNERIQINDEYISDEDLLEAANELYPIIKQVEEELNDEMTEFEIITLLAFHYYAKKNVDIVVYEVGLGGRFDATNVIHPIVGGITNIGWDHMNVLGNTLEKIGYEKVGIAKPNTPIFTTETNPSVLEVFKNYCEQVNSTLTVVNSTDISDYQCLDDGINFHYDPLDLDLFIPMIGLHQLQNVNLALSIYRYVVKSRKMSLNPEYIYKGLKKAKWAGRLEIVSKKPFIIIDGSHNYDGIKTLVESLKYYTNKGLKIKMVFAALKDKETDKMLNLLQSVASHLTLTTFDFYRANTGKNLYEQTNKVNVSYNENYLEVLNDNIKNLKDDELLLITGSLYFTAIVKKYFKELK